MSKTLFILYCMHCGESVAELAEDIDNAAPLQLSMNGTFLKSASDAMLTSTEHTETLSLC